MQRKALCRSRRELSNAYLLAKFGFDTAVNEPFEVCPLSAYRSPRLQKEEAHRMTDTSIELRPERVKASRPWPITGPQVLGTPKTGEWEDAYFDIFEYGERGWASKKRLTLS